MKLSVVSVKYNVRYYVEECINSVVKATNDIESEVFVVDNHSQDGSVEHLKKCFPNEITLVESNHNLGFARANNIAISQSSGEYVLLLNPDTFVSEDSLREVLSFMDNHPKAGACGVMMHNADGSRARESRRALPTPIISLMKMLGRSDRYYMSHLSWEEPGQIEVISGAFCMIRRDVLDKIGLLDETFFMYGEDIDLSYRVLKGGFENWYVPARILHYKGESTQKSSFRYVHVFYQAMLIFFRKHYGHLSFLVTLPIKSAIYLRAFLALIQMGCDECKRSLGFVSQHSLQPNYVFVGSPAMLEECRRLSRRKGLSASFVSARKEASVEEYSCVVYDTSTFSFSQILQESHDQAQPNVMIGTYSMSNHVLITPKEIIL
jgi:GT2 family glycosyltransferase